MPYFTTNDAMYYSLQREFGGNLHLGDYLSMLYSRYPTLWTQNGQYDFYKNALNVSSGDIGDLANKYWTAQHEAPRILTEDAVLWLDADSYDGSQLWRNKGTGGAVLDARLGSVGVANGGAFIADGALNLPGVAGNHATLPNSALLYPDIFDVQTVLVDFAVPATAVGLMGKYETSGQYSWLFRLLQTGHLNIVVSFDGTTANVNISSATVLPGFLVGQKVWLRATRNAATGLVEFLYSLDGNSWTVHHSVFHNTGSMFAGTSSLSIGGSAGYFGSCVIERCVLLDDGVTVFDADFTNLPDGTTSFRESANGAVVTVANSGTDTNDPLWLRAEETNGYVYQPGNTDYMGIVKPAVNLQTKDTYSLSIEGAFDNVAALRYMLGYASSGTGGGGIALRIDATRIPSLLSHNGTAFVSAVATLPYPVNCFNSYSKFKVDVVRGISVSFYYALGQSGDWVLLEQIADTTNVGVGGQSTFFIGSNAGSQPAIGTVYKASFTVDGVVNVDVDFSTLTEANQSSFVCSTGQTVTFSRSASSRKLVVMPAKQYGGRSKFLFGTDDYMEIPDNALLDIGAGEDFSAVAVMRIHGSSVYQNIWGTKIGGGAASPGWMLMIDSSNGGRRYLEISDGTNADFAQVFGLGSGRLESVVGMRSAGTINTFSSNNVGISFPAVNYTLISTNPLRIGQSPGGTYPIDMECVALAFFRRALSANERTAIVNYYGGQ